MNNQKARSLFMDYLYDEISAEERKKLLAYLEAHPELQQELDSLKKTRTLLQQMPAGEPDQKLLVIEPGKRSFSQWWHEAKNLLPQSAWGKAGFAAAAGLALFLFIGSVANLHITNTKTGFTVGLGEQPVVNEGITADQADALLNQIRKENAAMLTEFAKDMDRQNRQQLQQVVRYFEQQRRNDLELIDHTFTQLQENTTEQWLTTNSYLGDLLQNINFKNQNE